VSSHNVKSSKRTLIAKIIASLRAIDADMDRLDEAAAARLGVHRSDFRGLDILSRSSRMTAGQLAVEAGLTTGAVTALIDRLERAGYARRRRDAHDRRRVLVEPTARAASRVWPLFKQLVAESTTVLRGFDAQELWTIVRFLELSKKVIRRHARSVASRDQAGERLQ
jgi:DNA-binding MarR family transcriptional regulator